MLEDSLKKNRNMKLKRLTERMRKVKEQYGEVKEEQKEILAELRRTRLSSFNSVDSMDMEMMYSLNQILEKSKLPK